MSTHAPMALDKNVTETVDALVEPPFVVEVAGKGTEDASADLSDAEREDLEKAAKKSSKTTIRRTKIEAERVEKELGARVVRLRSL